jgi:membrane protein
MTAMPRAPRSSGRGREASLIARWRKRAQTVRLQLVQTRPVRAYSRFINVGGSVLTGGMSYQALFAVFAALWVGFGVFGVVLNSQDDLLEALTTQINVLVPGLLGADGAVSLQPLLADRVFDWTRIIASVSLLWVAVAWFTGTRRSIRIIFGLEVRRYRNAALLKLRDFVLAIGFSLAIMASASLTLIGADLSSNLLSFFGLSADHWLVGGTGTLVRLAALYLFDVLLLVAIHRWLAEVRVPWWPLVSGCALGSIGALALKVAGGALLGGASTNPLFTSFAVFIGLLLWFNLICRVLLLTSAWIATGQDSSLGLPDNGESNDEPAPQSIPGASSAA